jgi:hypothetical protein
MGLVMIDADERFPQGERDGLRGLESDEQGRRQTRPLRGGDGVELSRLHPRFMQRGLHDGNQIPQMFAGGKFRHDAAVFGVQLDLRGDGAGQNPAVAHDRGAGFVAGGFKGQKSHACWSSSFSLSQIKLTPTVGMQAEA